MTKNALAVTAAFLALLPLNASAVAMETLLDDHFEAYALGPLDTGLPAHSSNLAPLLQGDPAIVTGPVTQGGDVVSPRSGSQMLQFLKTHDGSGSQGVNHGVNGDMYYLFDLSHLGDAIAAGDVNVTLGGYFNSGASGWNADPSSAYFGQVDNAFFVGLSAWSGDMSLYPTTGRNRRTSPYHLGTINNYNDPLVTDRDESTWEYTSVNMMLPAGTTYLAARIAANENVHRNSEGYDFVSSFADDITAEVNWPGDPPILIGPPSNPVPDSGSSLLLLIQAFGGFMLFSPISKRLRERAKA